MERNLILETSEGNIQVSDNALLIFVDETGEDEMRDPNHPVFGLGGIVVSHKDYVQAYRDAWMKMKSDMFDVKSPLHACDLPRYLSSEQIQALNKQFLSNFGRVAVTTSAKVENLTEYQIHHVVSSVFIDKAKLQAKKYCQFDVVILIFEESQRGDPLIKKNFASFNFDICGNSTKILKFTMPKSACEPGLEIADFVIHTAGAQTRENMSLKNPRDTHKVKLRKDFEVMFRNNPNNGEFMFITKLAANE